MLYGLCRNQFAEASVDTADYMTGSFGGKGFIRVTDVPHRSQACVNGLVTLPVTWSRRSVSQWSLRCSSSFSTIHRDPSMRQIYVATAQFFFLSYYFCSLRFSSVIRNSSDGSWFWFCCWMPRCHHQIRVNLAWHCNGLYSFLFLSVTLLFPIQFDFRCRWCCCQVWLSFVCLFVSGNCFNELFKVVSIERFSIVAQ